MMKGLSTPWKRGEALSERIAGAQDKDPAKFPPHLDNGFHSHEGAASLRPVIHASAKVVEPGACLGLAWGWGGVAGGLSAPLALKGPWQQHPTGGPRLPLDADTGQGSVGEFGDDRGGRGRNLEGQSWRMTT